MLKLLRSINAILLLIIGLNALGGGWYGIAGAKDVPLEWLEGSPFKSYMIPGLFLFFVIGGSCFIASTAFFLNKAWAPRWGLYTGLLLICWIVIQVYLIGYVSWMQPAILISGIIISILSLRAKSRSNVS